MARNVQLCHGVIGGTPQTEGENMRRIVPAINRMDRAFKRAHKAWATLRKAEQEFSEAQQRMAELGLWENYCETYEIHPYSTFEDTGA